MRRWSIPPQITRIILLTIGIVTTYLLAREFLTPPSFGQYGWYRGEALVEIRSPEPVFAGKKLCAECHAEQAAKVAERGHKSLACEGCHGAAQAHAVNPDIKTQILTYSHCVRCHEVNLSRPAWHKQIDTKEHFPGEACTDCHPPHDPLESQ